MILRARWVLPVDAPPIEHGAVRIEGDTIAAVERAADMGNNDVGVEDLGDVALLPGFVNAHAHLELSCYANALPPGPLWGWLDALIELRRRPGAAERERAAVVDGARRSLLAGVTCIGDISRNGAHIDRLRTVPIRKVCFLELISGAATAPSNPDELRDLFDRAAGAADPLTTLGLSPHSLYTVAWNDLRRVVALAAERDLPITMHVAETADELQWLEAGGGAAAEFIRRHDLPLRPFDTHGGFMELLHRAGMTRLRPLLAHVNYIDDEQFRLLAGSSCSVVYCPRAHLFFGHPPHRWRDMLAAGVNVCLGTDSLASNDSLSILDDIRLLHRLAPDVAAETLLDMATRCAARALGLEPECGAIRAGLRADLVVVPLSTRGTAEPLQDVVAGDEQPSDVWVGGRRVVRSGTYVD